METQREDVKNLLYSRRLLGRCCGQWSDVVTLSVEVIHRNGIFTEATNVRHADGISRHRLMPYDVHTLQYKLCDYTILSSFQSQCKRMLDLKLFNEEQLAQLSERLFQLSTILLLKANF